MRDYLLGIFRDLVSCLDDSRLDGTGIIKAWPPVPYFGDLANSSVATVGLNPSDKEFEDDQGRELRGSARRFYSLDSLNIDSWSGLSRHDLISIKESCYYYFSRNPYDRWFGRFDGILSGLNISFGAGACHLDLVPYAAKQKWGRLKPEHRRSLLEVNRNTLIGLVRNSPLRVLVLNGTGVIRGFESAFGIRLEGRRMPSWDLARSTGTDFAGYSYRGTLEGPPNIEDPVQSVLVLGFNLNIQGTPGVGESVISSIGRWVAREGEAYLSGNFIRT